jgi:hypothetical protein
MTKHDTRNSPPSLWEQAVDLWRDLILGFGRPLDLVRWVFMRRMDHRALGYAICEVEKIVRNAVRADARDLDLSELKLAPARARRPKPAPAPNDGAPGGGPSHGPNLNKDPESWTASFRMSPGGARTGPRPSRAGKPRPEPRDRRNAIPYAWRMEAVRRVIFDSSGYVLRYARRLVRRAEQGALARAAEAKRSAVQALCASLLNDHGLPVNVELSPTVWSAKHEEPG